MSTIPIVLTIAGSDSSGGAGIQADIKTFSALGVYATSVITAVTAQNTCEVSGVLEIEAKFIRLQMQTLFKDININAIKIGMLANQLIVKEVAEGLRELGLSDIVLDPVIVAQSGAKLLADEAISSLVEELFPLVKIITPNIPEAAALLGITEEEVAADVPQAARLLNELGAAAVLIKGGHSLGKTADDWFLEGDSMRKFSAPRQNTTHTHGSGCTLSSAICGYLARGFSLFESVERGKKYVTNAIAAGKRLDVGKGSGPLHHFYQSTNWGH